VATNHLARPGAATKGTSVRAAGRAKPSAISYQPSAKKIYITVPIFSGIMRHVRAQ